MHMKNCYRTTLTLVFVMLVTSCSYEETSPELQEVASVPISQTPPGHARDLRSKLLANRAAYIPPQCYTKTLDRYQEPRNPCYTCHIDPIQPNFNHDADLQETLSFPNYARVNRWSNIFKDRKSYIASLNDEETLSYVKQSNYLDTTNSIILENTLTKSLPLGWDNDGDGKWTGYVPDCYFLFDSEGFDRAPNGELTGWRAFGYTPFPGTFWPTNGSSDDVIIRLPEIFRRDEGDIESLETYKINLAILEAIISRRDVPISPVSEIKYNVDLNLNGTLDVANHIRFNLKQAQTGEMHYVGAARLAMEQGHIRLYPGLYPVGTEFLHSVRYLDLVDHKVVMANRMKELRYAKKVKWFSSEDLEMESSEEIESDHFRPDALDSYFGDVETGLYNNSGWIYQGFIEDSAGQLRPQTYEETLYCMGCHAKLGATTDNTFAFRRKLSHEHDQSGWFHWTQKDLGGIAEPQRYDGQFEYTLYLKLNQAGDEFRENHEVIQSFFSNTGDLLEEKTSVLHEDISVLLNPSPERALALNKAYKAIVDEQSFIYGRDATISPAQNVYESVDIDQSTGILSRSTGPYVE